MRVAGGVPCAVRHLFDTSFFRLPLLISCQASAKMRVISAHCSRCVRHARRVAERAPVRTRAATKTPSSATGSDLLEQIQLHTVTLPDSALESLSAAGEGKASAALVNFGLMSHVLANPSAFYEVAVSAHLSSSCLTRPRACDTVSQSSPLDSTMRGCVECGRKRHRTCAHGEPRGRGGSARPGAGKCGAAAERLGDGPPRRRSGSTPC